MLAKGTLENKRAIIEQYVDKVIIYPDNIEIKFNLIEDFRLTENVEK